MIVRRPIALHALVEQATWIFEHSPAQAEAFFAAVDATLKHLEQHPTTGKPFIIRGKRFKGLRYMRVGKFRNHLVFYFPHPDGIEWVHLLHGARDLSRVIRADV